MCLFHPDLMRRPAIFYGRDSKAGFPQSSPIVRILEAQCPTVDYMILRMLFAESLARKQKQRQNAAAK